MHVDQVLSVHLEAAAELAGARVAALFVPTPSGLELRAQKDLLQPGLDATTVAWATQERKLREGHLVRTGDGLVWPLLLGKELAALVYLDQARPEFPEEHEAVHGQVLAMRARRLIPPRPLGPFVASVASPEAEQRRQLQIVLRQVAGNVTAAASVLGVNRDTVYERAARFGLDLGLFRPARRKA